MNNACSPLAARIIHKRLNINTLHSTIITKNHTVWAFKCKKLRTCCPAADV